MPDERRIILTLRLSSKPAYIRSCCIYARGCSLVSRRFTARPHARAVACILASTRESTAVKGGSRVGRLGNEGLWRAAIAFVLILAMPGAVLAESDCWCARYVDLRDEVPTRNVSVLLRIAASVGLTGATFWAVDALGLPNASWYKVGALVSGLSNTASALADLMLPTSRALERDAERIAESTLSEDLCAETLAEYAASVRTRRYVRGSIGLASGVAQFLLLSPYGTYATGDIYDYIYLVTGGLELGGGLISILFPTGFERGFEDAVEACGP